MARAERNVPDIPGLYTIFVDSPESLPPPFSLDLTNRHTCLLYLGKAGSSLKQRLVEQDLLGKKNSTFFRAIGAVLGYRPLKGSLRERTNQNNYRFSVADRRTLAEWNRTHISVRWSERARLDLEPRLIAQLRPIFNKHHNPSPYAPLGELRELCRSIARG